MFGRGRNRKGPRFQREPRADLEDLRDDCIALFLNSGLRQWEIADAGGPTPATISKWLYKETRFPRLDTIRAFVRAMGYDLGIQPGRYQRQFEAQRMPAKIVKAKKK